MRAAQTAQTDESAEAGRKELSWRPVLSEWLSLMTRYQTEPLKEGECVLVHGVRVEGILRVGEVKQQGQFQSAAVRSVKLEAEREHRHKSWATKTEDLALVTHSFPKVLEPSKMPIPPRRKYSNTCAECQGISHSNHDKIKYQS